jgi:hypothetical protein
MRNVRTVVGRPEGKSPFGRPGLRWEDNTKMNVKEINCMLTGFI